MTPHQIRILGLFVLGAAMFLPSPGERCVYAQGRNVFEVQRGPSTSPARPKTSDETRDRLRQSFQREFSVGMGETGSYLYYVVFLVFLGILIGVLAYRDFDRRKSEKPGFDNSLHLFRELCAAHHLTAVERRFLRDFAEDMDLEDPLPLFIEPRYFYDALDERRHDDFSRMLRYLLVKLFDIRVAQETKAAESGIRSPKSADQHTATTIYVPPQQNR